jgi:hypothetical protein
LQGNIVEAALLKFAFTPLPEGTMGPRRDHPDKMEPAKKLNYWQELAISKNSKLWDGRTMPQFAVLVEEIKEGKFRFAGATLLPWSGDLRIAGVPPFGLETLGTLTGEQRGDVYELEGWTPTVDWTDRINREPAEVAIIQIDASNVDEIVEAALESKMELVQQSAEYTGDKFSVDPATGHFIGDDGFRVPRNFEEFWERYPHYLTNWVKKRLHKHIIDEDVEDWQMDLLMHMKYLPERSKHRLPGANGREAGATDVVETFDPVKQYGASEKRFRNYINMCLANRFNTIMSKRSKNPVCRPGNYSLAAQMDPDNYEVVDDEYVHAKSEYLSHSAHREMKTHEDRMFINEFFRFLEENDPAMITVAQALSITGTYGEAQRECGMTEQDFNRARNRLKVLRDAFLNRTEVPKQRKPYRTRRTVPETVQ